jgi:hypothetical protein
MEVGELRHYRATSLAISRRAIQRKRIHNLSTGRAVRLSAWFPALAALLIAGGCAGRGSAGASTDRTLELIPMPSTIRLAPNQQATATFKLDNGGVPVAGRTVSFAIVPTDPAGAKGATLTTPSDTTDASGLVSVGIRAGLPVDFQVQAQSGSVSGVVTVIVDTGGSGNLRVAPFFAPMSTAAQRATSIHVLLYDNGVSCAGIDPDYPPAAPRDVVLSTGQSTASFPYVSTDSSSAAFGEALGPGPTILATGCVDVPGPSLQPGLWVQVNLPLIDAVPDPVGTFTVTSTFTFAPPLAVAATLAARWADLSDCPLDPAQLWLDCTVDALSPTTAGDPLDCVPATGAGAEGAVGDAIGARRGARLVDGTGAVTGCRGALAAGGGEGLDAVVLGLFGAPTPPAITGLQGIADDAASILQSVRLTSSLNVAPGTQTGAYVATHTLMAAQFGAGWPVSVPLAPLGLPVLQAVASASIQQGALAIATHGFTLRLGTTARAAFGPLALAPRGFPADTLGFLYALFTQAQAAGGAMGCDALDATVCPAIGQPAGCVTAACLSGLQALAGILDNAFLAADGPGLDLQLAGTAPMVAVPGGLLAQRLGVGEKQSSSAATWNASVVTSQGTAAVVAPFEGLRN